MAEAVRPGDVCCTAHASPTAAGTSLEGYAPHSDLGKRTTARWIDAISDALVPAEVPALRSGRATPTARDAPRRER